jgi:hypothetical protein
LCFFGHFELFQPPISTFWLWGVVQTLILHELGSNLFNKANSWSNKSLKLNLSKKIYFYYAQWAAKVRRLNRKTYFFHHSPTLAHFFLKFWQVKKKKIICTVFSHSPNGQNGTLHLKIGKKLITQWAENWTSNISV